VIDDIDRPARVERAAEGCPPRHERNALLSISIATPRRRYGMGADSLHTLDARTGPQGKCSTCTPRGCLAKRRSVEAPQ
jgi:hypothetical protein